MILGILSLLHQTQPGSDNCVQFHAGESDRRNGRMAKRGKPFGRGYLG